MFRNIDNKMEYLLSTKHFKIESTMSNSNTNTASSSRTLPETVLPKNVIRVDLTDQSKKNKVWITKFKRDNNVTKQTVLPSATMKHNEWAIKSEWSMSDATTWRSLCEKVKFALDDIEGEGLLVLIQETIMMAQHCGTHPIGLIHYARTEHGRVVWDVDSLDYLRAHLLPEEEQALDVRTPPASPEPSKRKVQAPSAPRKRRLVEEMQATQPQDDMSDDVIRD